MVRVSECCIDCSRRTVGCHATCSDYKVGRAMYDEQREEIRRQKQADRLVSEFEFATKQRIRRRSRRVKK